MTALVKVVGIPRCRSIPKVAAIPRSCTHPYTYVAGVATAEASCRTDRSDRSCRRAQRVGSEGHRRRYRRSGGCVPAQPLGAEHLRDETTKARASGAFPYTRARLCEPDPVILSLSRASPLRLVKAELWCTRSSQQGPVGVRLVNRTHPNRRIVASCRPSRRCWRLGGAKSP
jgi:hypothetical protein